MNIPQLPLSSIIEGRWNKNKYKIKEKIGEGGIAAVYLVEEVQTKQQYAIKISKDSISINREYQLLKKFHKVDMIVETYEIDDLKLNGETYYYILLEYIKGENLKEYNEKNKLDNTIIISVILIILKGLQTFHDEEYIIGDLKLENLMLDKRNSRLKIIDLGGVVKKGDTIKEFTPPYDRASWKCGERIAEASYDLFTVMIVFIKLLLKEAIHPKNQKIEDVIEKLKKLDLDKELENFIIEGLLKNKKSLNFYIKNLKKLYNRERRYQLQKRLLLKERRVNILLSFSIVFFITTIIFLFLI